jgi:hypothetical protein
MIPRATAIRSVYARPDWADAKSYKRKWADRARVAARLCTGYRWICDLGCGMQALRLFLPRDTVYLPADLKQWTDDTEICNIDAGLMPSRYLQLSDLCVMLGVVDHLRDPGRSFKLLANSAENILFSYQSTDFSRDNPAHQRANDFTLAEMYSLLEEARFQIIEQIQFRRLTLIKARNLGFDTVAASSRAEKRIAFKARPWTLRDEYTRLALMIWTRKVANYRMQ